MKNFILRPLGLLAATALAASVAPTSAFAQNEIQFVASPDSPQWQAYRIKNVTPEALAYWLDAKHHSLRPGSQDAKPTWAIGKTDAEVKAMLSLPEGVSAIARLDSQNVLWVWGTPTGQKQMAEKIVLLDKPIQQIEVEAQIVRISAADAKTLGVAFLRKDGPIEIGMASADIDDRMAALTAQNKAKVITAPRVTAIFGAQAALASTTTATILVTIKTENGDIKLRNWTKQDRLEDQISLPISTTIQLSVTPTLNPDGTISLAVGPFRTVGISGLAVGQPISQPVGFPNDTSPRAVLKDPDNIPTQPITMKDGQTAVLQGLNWGNSVFASSKTLPINIVVLLTAHRIRRAGDADFIPPR